MTRNQSIIKQIEKKLDDPQLSESDRLWAEWCLRCYKNDPQRGNNAITAVTS